MHECTYVYVCVYVCICMYMCVYMCVYVCICVCICMYMCVYMCVYVCVPHAGHNHSHVIMYIGHAHEFYSCVQFNALNSSTNGTTSLW